MAFPIQTGRHDESVILFMRHASVDSQQCTGFSIATSFTMILNVVPQIALLSAAL